MAIKIDFLLEKYQKGEKDTGSAAVQIIHLTEEILELAEHLKKHPKDNSSRVGLLKKVGKRRRLLNYLAKKSPDTYKKLIKELGLRK